MRKTIIQLIVLLIAGAVVVWREGTTNVMVEAVLPNLPLPAAQLAETSSIIIWLVGVAIVVMGLTEWFSRYFKLSSPNSV